MHQLERSKPFLLFFLISALALDASQSSKRQGTRRGSESVDPNGTLQIFCSGRLRIHGSSGSQLLYRSSQDGPDNRIEFARDGHGATFRAMVSDLDLTIPRALHAVSVHTLGGDLEVENLDGSFLAEAAGRITLNRMKGDVKVRSGGGPTFLGSVGGEVQCISAGGPILADFLHQAASLQTGGGDIVVQRAAAQLRVSTAGGTIHVGRADAAVTAINYGGPIEIGAAQEANCETTSGTIHLANIRGPIQATTGIGSITAELLNGNFQMDSLLSTGQGDIIVVLPSNLSVNIRAQNKGSRNARIIVSEFEGLQMKALRTSVLAEGILNGGGPLLQLTGSGGSIYIRKR